jgi:hypothetical protein
MRNFLILVILIVLFVQGRFQDSKLLKCQLQIDELCSMALTLVREKESTVEDTGLQVGVSYDFLFADLGTGTAVLSSTRHGVKKQKPFYTIVNGVNLDTLKSWHQKPKKIDE